MQSTRVAQAWTAGVVVATCLAAVSAQSKPDFSGRWTTDTDPATVAGSGRTGGRGDLGSGWGSTIAITQDAAKFVVEYAFFGRGDMQPPLKFVYALDGSETRNSVMMGRGIQTLSSMTKWQGDKLAITTIFPFVDPDSARAMTMEVTQVLSLESPASLVVETTRAATLGGPANTTRTVYRKL
jgi:arylsulfatase